MIINNSVEVNLLSDTYCNECKFFVREGVLQFFNRVDGGFTRLCWDCLDRTYKDYDGVLYTAMLDILVLVHRRKP